MDYTIVLLIVVVFLYIWSSTIRGVLHTSSLVQIQLDAFSMYNIDHNMTSIHDEGGSGNQTPANGFTHAQSLNPQPAAHPEPPPRR